MVLHLNLDTHKTREDILRFLEGNAAGSVVVPDRAAAYEHIGQVLRRFSYWRLSKPDRGLVKRYLERTTGLSRAQLTRLVKCYLASGQLRAGRRGAGRRFQHKYQPQDIELLAETDELHGTLSGPATLALCQRAWQLFGDERFQRLAQLSNGHLYNLRRSARYLRRLGSKAGTRPAAVTIAERRRPRPNGRPGYVRVDSVHQGDRGKVKGVYHINLVDEVTQFQFVGSVERISEHFLLPVLEDLLGAFPFRICGLHSDNGSEYINHRVAGLLEKLRSEQFTKSRPRRSNDNALVESKNGTVVRKQLGYGHIAGRHAERLHQFNREVLSPYLNYHRPCYFPSEEVDAKGKLRKRYRQQDLCTPYEQLKALPEAAACLRAGLDFVQLDAEAYRMSDNEAARRLNEARDELFAAIRAE